jgi:hypothetical protein
MSALAPDAAAPMLDLNDDPLDIAVVKVTAPVDALTLTVIPDTEFDTAKLVTPPPPPPLGVEDTQVVPFEVNTLPDVPGAIC